MGHSRTRLLGQLGLWLLMLSRCRQADQLRYTPADGDANRRAELSERDE